MTGHATGHPTAEKSLKQMVARNIDAAIKAHEPRLTSADVARELETHEKSVRRWRNGEATPGAAYMARLALLLKGGEVGWFYTDHEANGDKAA